MDQLTPDELFAVIDQESNSVAILVRHMHGNMLSRWTDFLATDGEKSTRDRDREFIAPVERTREHLIDLWTEGWACVHAALTTLQSEDVLLSVRIRGESMSVPTAIIRQVDHYAQHVGQIVVLAKHWRGSSWKTLSVPRGKSEEFNREFRAKT